MKIENYVGFFFGPDPIRSNGLPLNCSVCSSNESVFNFVKITHISKYILVN